MRHTPTIPGGRLPKRSPIYCAACGRIFGWKPGAEVTLNAICDSPLCQYQGPSTINARRDEQIVFAVLEGVPVSQVAFVTNTSRQRIYQILDNWRRGVGSSPL